MREVHDAIKLPKGYVKGGSDQLRFHRTFDMLEDLLGVDRSKGERARAREQQPGGYLFVTKGRKDTMYFPVGHPRHGRPRYTWTPGPRGIQFGKLVPDAQ